MKAIESLKFTSLLGLCIYGAFALITVLLFLGGVNCGGTENAPAASIDLLVAIPIQTLAFACHTVVFPGECCYDCLTCARRRLNCLNCASHLIPTSDPPPPPPPLSFSLPVCCSSLS